ncbi:hypothetical protein JHK82_042913 [Glycine max]|nr:hypothetical protein JHK82_042913 [Glycine max]
MWVCVVSKKEILGGGVCIREVYVVRHGSGIRPRGNQIEPAPTLTDKNRVDRVRSRIRVFPDNPKRGRGRSLYLSLFASHKFTNLHRCSSSVLTLPLLYFNLLSDLDSAIDEDTKQYKGRWKEGKRVSWIYPRGKFDMHGSLSWKVMEDISFSPEGTYHIPSPINESPSPSPIDQTPSPIQVDLAPSPSPINVDHTPSTHEDEVNNVEASSPHSTLSMVVSASSFSTSFTVSSTIYLNLELVESDSMAKTHEVVVDNEEAVMELCSKLRHARWQQLCESWDLRSRIQRLEYARYNWEKQRKFYRVIMCH